MSGLADIFVFHISYHSKGCKGEIFLLEEAKQAIVSLTPIPLGSS